MGQVVDVDHGDRPESLVLRGALEIRLRPGLAQQVDPDGVAGDEPGGGYNPSISTGVCGFSISSIDTSVIKLPTPFSFIK